MLRAESSLVMKALALDINKLMSDEARMRSFAICGVWPKSCHIALQRMIYGNDGFASMVLAHWRLQHSDTLVALTQRISEKLDILHYLPQNSSALAEVARSIEKSNTRRNAVVLYCRAASAICQTVSILLTNALWLVSQGRVRDVESAHIIAEALRLLPPAWMYLRTAGKEFIGVHDEITEKDDLLVVPFLAHRDPNVWDTADKFAPHRWRDVKDPQSLTHYLPFGHGDDRCWARKLVLGFSEKLLTFILANGLRADPKQSSVFVPKGSLLAISKLTVVRSEYR